MKGESAYLGEPCGLHCFQIAFSWDFSLWGYILFKWLPRETGLFQIHPLDTTAAATSLNCVKTSLHCSDNVKTRNWTLLWHRKHNFTSFSKEGGSVSPPTHFMCLVYGQTGQDDSRCGDLQRASRFAVCPEEIIHCPIKNVDCPRIFRFLDLIEAA